MCELDGRCFFKNLVVDIVEIVNCFVQTTRSHVVGVQCSLQDLKDSDMLSGGILAIFWRIF